MTLRPRAGRFWPVLAICTTALAATAQAQLATQAISLRPGWNAVYLEVDPENPDPATVFTGVPVRSVWKFTKSFQTEQYLQNPAELLPQDPDWLVWFPATEPQSAANSLFRVFGPSAYLINYSGTSAGELRVKGRPEAQTYRWVPDSLNLVGFPLQDSGTPTFDAFLAGATGLAGEARFRLDAAGTWVPAAGTETLRRGEAFWQFARGPVSFSGPFEVTRTGGRVLSFGELLSDAELTIVNKQPTPCTLTVTQLASEAPSTTTGPELAGTVPLSTFRMDLTPAAPEDKEFGFEPLDGPLSISLAANETRVLRVGIRRTDFAAFTPSTGRTAEYQSILSFDDGRGSQVFLPVTASWIPTEATSGRKAFAAGTVALNRTGLWVGTVSVDKVNVPAHPDDPNLPRPTASAFEFPVIIHKGANGKANLLQEVFLMYKPPVVAPDPQFPGTDRITELGQAVLVSDRALLSKYSGSIGVSGDSAARRLSSSAFSFRGKKELAATAASGQANPALAVSLAVPWNDPLNPFVHRYHPSHDNRNRRFDGDLADGDESWTVTRGLRFEFTDVEPNGVQVPGWGDTVVGGIYEETISGLTKSSRPLKVRGTFRLSLAATADTLDPPVN